MPKRIDGGFSTDSDHRNSDWIARQTSSPEARRAYEEERLVAWSTDAVTDVMEATGLSRSEIAARLGTSRAHVTQVLGGSRNMTLRTLAGLAWAMGHRVVVTLEPLNEDAADACRPARETSGSMRHVSAHRS